MLRRSFLLSTSMLGGCALAPIIGAAAAWASDASLIAGGVSSLIPIVGQITGLSSAAQKTVTDYLSQAQQAANDLAKTSTSGSAATDLKTVEGLLNDVLAIVEPNLQQGSVPQVILAAAEALLPTIEAVVNPLVTARRARAVSGVTFTPDQARVILRGATAKR